MRWGQPGRRLAPPPFFDKLDSYAPPRRGRTALEVGITVTILNNVLIVLIFLTSILLTLTVLMHKGQGGGLSDMFGGGISSSAGSSGVAERNLNRITLGTLLIWLVCIVGYALLAKFGG